MARYGLQKIVEDTGMTVDEICEEGTFDGVLWGVCRKCGYTVRVEPDQDAGWCADCDTKTVVSALFLLGII